MAKSARTHNGDLSLRHTLATLGYRASKTMRDAPDEFSKFRPGKGSRSAGEILSHICDLMDWALSIARGKQRWRNTKPKSWAEDCERFFLALTALDQYLASDEPLHAPAGKLFQGAVADALTHVGQIGMLRRLAGSRIRAENYYRARIEIGRTGPDQRAPVSEFG